MRFITTFTFAIICIPSAVAATTQSRCGVAIRSKKPTILFIHKSYGRFCVAQNSNTPVTLKHGASLNIVTSGGTACNFSEGQGTHLPNGAEFSYAGACYPNNLPF